MTLPTVQPFDYPDWGTPGIFQTTSYNVPVITGPLQVAAEVATGYYNHALVVFSGEGDGEDYVMGLQYYTASPSEGGQPMWQNDTVRIFGTTVVVPLTSAGGWLRVVSVSATTYPHNALFSITLFSAWGTMTGWPGGITVINRTDTIAATDELVYADLSCGPGPHSAQITTLSPFFTLWLRTWQNETDFADTFLADELTVPLYNIEWLAPASSWTLRLENREAAPHDFSVIVVRAPT